LENFTATAVKVIIGFKKCDRLREVTRKPDESNVESFLGSFDSFIAGIEENLKNLEVAHFSE
jgi:hypothetical protein